MDLSPFQPHMGPKKVGVGILYTEPCTRFSDCSQRGSAPHFPSLYFQKNAQHKPKAIFKTKTILNSAQNRTGWLQFQWEWHEWKALDELDPFMGVPTPETAKMKGFEAFWIFKNGRHKPKAISKKLKMFKMFKFSFFLKFLNFHVSNVQDFQIFKFSCFSEFSRFSKIMFFSKKSKMTPRRAGSTQEAL